MTVPFTLRLAAGVKASSGDVSNIKSLKQLTAGVSEINIDIIDQVSPFLEKNRAGKLYNQALKYALRRATGHFRKDLEKSIGFSVGNKNPKRILNPEGVQRFLSNLQYSRKKGYDIESLRKKHLHQDKRPWQRAIKKTITYRKLREDGLAYSFGFTGKKKSGNISKTAILYGKALTEGKFINKAEGKVSNEITGRMRRYLSAIGLPPSGDQLDFPERPVIEPYFQKNKQNIVRYITKLYNQEARRIQKKADATRARRTKVRIA